jgi:DNA (cytosine-5)-methyltransferase 1
VTSLTFASMFAGVGGFDLGFEQAGMSPTVQVEIDRNASKVLAAHWPDTPRGEDISDVTGADIGRPDVVVGGFPCQDTSIAAPHRDGLAGARSGMFWEFHRVLGEHLRLVAETAPRWTVIENPSGLLSSHGGRDMAAVVRGLEDLGYGWAYRVVDSRHLGCAGRRSPQRRPRVLVVGHLGGDPRPAGQVLGVGGPGSEAAPAGGVRGGSRGPKALVGPVGDSEALIFRKSARARKSIDKGGYETWVPAEVANTLTGFDGGGPLRQTHLVVQAGRVRSLTLTEWERLSGLPDGFTAMIPESARYTAIGNIAHPALTEWLGRQIVAVDAALPMIRVA